jgi:hypothetical protein
VLSLALHAMTPSEPRQFSEPTTHQSPAHKAPSIALKIISTCYALGIHVDLKALDRICDTPEHHLLDCCAVLDTVHALWWGLGCSVDSKYPALRSAMVGILERLAALELKELLASEPTERI